MNYKDLNFGSVRKLYFLFYSSYCLHLKLISIIPQKSQVTHNHVIFFLPEQKVALLVVNVVHDRIVLCMINSNVLLIVCVRYYVLLWYVHARELYG